MKKILPLLLLTTTVCAETHLALPTGNAAGNDTQISAATAPDKSARESNGPNRPLTGTLMQRATDNVAPASTPSNLSEAEQKKIFEEAKTASAREDYARALELFHRLAAGGHGEAMEKIGLMYYRGEGVAEDYASAKRWFEKAIAAGNSDSYERIGRLYDQGGPGLERDYATAKQWYEKDGDAGNSDGYRSIGYLYKEGGPGLERNWATATQWFEKFGDAGDSFGYGLVGRLYETGGPGLEKDLAQACHYYQKAGPDWQTAAERTCSR